MATAVAAFGTTVTADAAAVGGVRNISVDKIYETADVTHHSSTGAWREKVTTVRGASITMELNYDETDVGQVKIDAAFGSGGAIQFVVTTVSTGASVFTFDAFVTNLSLPQPVDGALIYNVTLEVTGPVTIT